MPVVGQPMMKPVPFTALRIADAGRPLSNDPIGLIDLPMIEPIAPEWRASIVTIDAAASSYAGVLILPAWPR
jgi:hypothetical protein